MHQITIKERIQYVLCLHLYANLLLLCSSINLHCKVDLMENLLGTRLYHTDHSGLSLHHFLLHRLLLLHNYNLLLGSHCSLISVNS